MLTVELVTGFKNLIIRSVNRELNLQLDPDFFDIRLVSHDRKRFIMCVEIFYLLAPQRRFRCYIKGLTGFDIGKFKLYEDPGFEPGPGDEVYANENDIDDATYRALVSHFSNDITPDELDYYNFILTEDRVVISTEDREPLVYM